jgi:hypothetical protein
VAGGGGRRAGFGGGWRGMTGDGSVGWGSFM